MYGKISKTKCKHKQNSAKIKVYFGSIGIFNFFGGRFELTHALFHSCLPFPEILKFLTKLRISTHLFGQLW